MITEPDDEIARLRSELHEAVSLTEDLHYCFREYLTWARGRANEIASEIEENLARVDQLLLALTSARMQRERNERS